MRNRTLSRCFEPIDEFLESNNLIRKQVPRDANSLFRAVAEKECMAQKFHEDVRQLCLDFMLLYKGYFQDYIREPLENYVSRMRTPLEWANDIEIRALSLLFKIDFWFYYEDCLPPKQLFSYGFKKTLFLYRDNSNHFDLVWSRNINNVTGFCQALIYQMLYTNVFKVENIMSIVDQMLHESNSCFRKDSSKSNDAEDIYRIVELVTDQNRTQDLLNLSLEYSSSSRDSTPPFPYRIAKVLDPDQYRNSEYDIYTSKRKEARYGPYDSKGLQIGVKVIIKTSLFSDEDVAKFDNEEKKLLEAIISNDGILHGHIQVMTENHGPVQVFVEELANRIFVPYDSLEKIPVRSMKETPFFGSPYKIRYPVPSPEIINSPSYSKRKKKFSYPLGISVNKTEQEGSVQMPYECEVDRFKETLISRCENETDEEKHDESVNSVVPPMVYPYPVAATVPPNFDYQGYYMMNPVPYPAEPVIELSKSLQMSLHVDASCPIPINGSCLQSYTYFPSPYNPASWSYSGSFMYGTPPGQNETYNSNNMPIIPPPMMYLEYYNPNQGVGPLMPFPVPANVTAINN